MALSYQPSDSGRQPSRSWKWERAVARSLFRNKITVEALQNLSVLGWQRWERGGSRGTKP
eukprot:2678519-Amphidinium_carterae.1